MKIKTKGKINREDLIQVVANWRLKDKVSNWKLVHMVMEEYGYKQSYAYEIVREARLKIADVYRKWNENALEQAIADLEDQKEQARKSNNYKLVLEITKEINKITGLYVERVEHSGDVTHNIQVIKLVEKSGSNS